MRALIVFLLLVFIFPTSAVPAAAGQQIVVGLVQNPPLIFSNSDGKPRGITADILTDIARDRDWSLQYLACSRAQCLKKIEAGIIDLFPGITSAEGERNGLAVGRETLAVDWAQVYVHPDAAPAHLLDFQDNVIALVRNTPYASRFESILKTFGIQAQFVQATDSDSVLSLVGRQKVAAGVVPRLYGAYAERRFDIHRSAISFDPRPVYFAVAKNRDLDILAALDNHLSTLKADPHALYHRSMNKWTGHPGRLKIPREGFPLWLFGAGISFVVVLVVIDVILRQRVKRHGAVLQETVAEKENIESELTVAREIQLQLVPAESSEGEGRKEFDIYASLQPAREVGGDFYDYFFIDKNTLCLVIGDVSGKGVPAALFMAMTKTMLKSAARLLVEPEYILADVNREIARNNPSLTFVTVFLGVLNLDTGLLTYTSAGHNPPLIIGRKGNSALLGEAQCPAIGLYEESIYHQATARLNHKEGLLLFTDGVIEAQDAKNRLFSQEALIRTISLTADISPRERIEAVLSRVREFSGPHPINDDLTLLALTYFSPDRVGDKLKTIVLKNDIQEMRRITNVLNRIADSVNCPPMIVHDVVLAVEELFSNTVFYGFGDDLEHKITVDVAAESGTLILTLQDKGIPFNPLDVHEDSTDKPLDARDKGGMGIILARNLMDRLDYRRERGKNILRMEKQFR